MSEQSAIELIKLWSGWFGQIVTLSSGLLLVLVAFREKIFPPHPTKEWPNLLSAFCILVSIAGFVVAIWGAVTGQFNLIRIMPGVISQTEAVTDIEEATKYVAYGFLAGISGFVAFAAFNLGLGGEKASRQRGADDK